MTLTPLRVPVASVQGTLALDLSPRHAPPELGDLTGSRAVADVVFRVDNFNSRWLGAAPSTVTADDLPDLHGHGTLAGLRAAARQSA